MQEKRNEQTTGTKTIKKIGKTTYEVIVHFNENATETGVHFSHSRSLCHTTRSLLLYSAGLPAGEIAYKSLKNIDKFGIIR